MASLCALSRKVFGRKLYYIQLLSRRTRSSVGVQMNVENLFNNLVTVMASVLLLCAVVSFIGALYFVPQCPNVGAQWGVVICGAISAICGGGAACLIIESEDE